MPLLGHDDVEAGLRRITSEHRSLEAGILLFDLIRKLKSHSGRTARADDQVRKTWNVNYAELAAKLQAIQPFLKRWVESGS